VGERRPRTESAGGAAAPQLSNFRRVNEEFMRSVGEAVYSTPRMDVFDSDPKCVERRLMLIQEELAELEAAVNAKDMVETIDALGDILYVVYGTGGAFGIDLDQAFDLVHRSNMSKLCTTEEEARETVEWYRKNYTPCGKYPYDTPEYRLAPEGRLFVVLNAATGKILKSVNYSPVKFDTILSAGKDCAGGATREMFDASSVTEVAEPGAATNFRKVTEQFMRGFGERVAYTPQMDVFESDPKTVNLRLSLIREEVRELVEAVQAKDMVETIDALADILYVVYGTGGAFGIDLDRAFHLIHESNMSKLCADEDEARQTVQWYNESCLVNGKRRYDSPDYKLGPDGRYVVFNASTRKTLKSVRYSPVKFDSMLPAWQPASAGA
jgi:predicted HAD superfamily Cof-like phosphohydrolase